MSNSETSFDVVIIGYGPTGATLANLLVMNGLTVAVLERESEIYHLPRAVHFDDETMRVFQTVGIGDALSEKLYVNPGMRFVGQNGKLLMDWPRPQEVGPQAWYASYRFHQPDLETLLRQALVQREGATIRANCEVVKLNDIGEMVEIECRDRLTGEVLEFRAGYVVGCDGARSMVRAAIGGDMEDLGFHERWLVIDALLKRERPDLGDHSVQYCNPDRPSTYCRSPGNRRRWELTVLDHENDEEITQQSRVWELLSDWITPEDAELERCAVYTFHSAIAAHWRKGRMMIAGDAAHLTPPFMGQGMCAGIRDASNLGWKLALCAHGLADPSLLDSYQEERSPHVREFITTAIRLGGLINTLDRDSALSNAKQDGPESVRMRSILPVLGASDLAGLGDLDTQHKGRLFSQPILSDGQRMDDLIGYAPVLITRDPVQPGPDADMLSLNAVDHPQIRGALDVLGVNAVLLRPDRYILATANTDQEIIRLAGTAFPSPLVARVT
ncbi:MAG: bifunctional 3-(3-hydroxy-phenyl)propionate/3-hydroxycinnamic acid hydroxylase [Rhizobiales bacterium]|nr:bifunctional 3-(3-hydroxy-phenyl)propionate/3-hydroxycinnamic acid hydroxylase [Hyphomicrobiales bacterium]